MFLCKSCFNKLIHFKVEVDELQFAPQRGQVIEDKISSGEAGQNTQQPSVGEPKIRSKFPETWIWSEYESK